MSLLDADGYEAVFGTPEGDIYRFPLVCWHDDGTHVSGMVLHKGQLRRAELVSGFMRYDTRPAPCRWTPTRPHSPMHRHGPTCPQP